MNAHAIRVVGLDTRDVLDLRRDVLRRGTPSNEPGYPEDDLPGTVHLGVLDAGVVVATSTWMPRENPCRPGIPALQLRGMAVADSLQRSGIGSLIVTAGLEHARSCGARVVWANARDTAIGFYERLGFVVRGDGFIEENSGLPHHVMDVEVGESISRQ